MISSEIIQYKEFIKPAEYKTILKRITDCGWTYGISSEINMNPLTPTNIFWSQVGLETDEYYSVYLFDKIKKITGQDFYIERIYMNGHTAGSHGNIHRDSDNKKGKTFLIYCNDVWLPDFGGGTTFICDDDNVTAYPYPYSAIYFSGMIPHFAAPLSPNFKGLRVTLAYKLLLK